MEHIKIIAPDPPKVEAGSWSAKSIQKLNDNLYRFIGLSFINNPEEEVITLSGKKYLGAYNNFYWHFIHEDLSNYEGLKLAIPDIDLVLIDLFDVMQDNKNMHEHNKSKFPYIDFFLDMYPQDVYLNRQKSNVYFEEAYYVLCTGDLFPEQDLFEQHGLAPRSIYKNDGFGEWYDSTWLTRTPYGVPGLNVLTEKVKTIVEKDESLPKKIFITRKDVNKRLADLINNPDYDHLISERYFDDSLLEKYFTNRGYVSVALEEFDYTKQLQYFMNATHVAGVVGAGFSKLFVADPGTELIELHAIPIYGFDYGYFKQIRDINYRPIDLRVLSESRAMTFEEMVTVLDESDL